MKRLIVIIIITIILSITVIIPNSLYLHSKTLWKWSTDCMIEYVNKHYPIWSIYTIDWLPHIDQRWIWNNFGLVEIKKINWCWIDDNILSFIINTPYCYTTLLYERPN